MLPLGMIVAFAGYGLGTWGYVLVKGYNITLREWFSPLHPFQGSLDSAGMVPKGSIFPTSGKGSSGSTSGGGSGGGKIQANPPGVPKGTRNPHGIVQ